MPTDVFTTGQAAKLCRVATRTMCKWLDRGRLPCYRLPDSGDRRIPRDSLVGFMRQHGMPLDGLEGPARPELPRVLTVTADDFLWQQLREALPGHAHKVAPATFWAAIAYYAWRPALAVIDLSIGRQEALALARSLEDCSGGRLGLVALAAEDEPDLPSLGGHGFDEALRKPISVATLAELLKSLTENPRG